MRQEMRGGAAALTRVFEHEGRPVVLTITVEPWGEDWRGVLEISGLHAPHRSEHPSIDSLGALLAAVRVAPVILASMAPGITWLGEADLGLT